MKKITINNTDLNVSNICYGTVKSGLPENKELDTKLIDMFVDEGGNFIDTARVYCDWIPGEKSRSEKFLGKWLKERGKRDSLVIATKGAHPDLDALDVARLTRDDIEFDVTGSLKDLKTDYIDLYYLHRDDENTPVEEIIDTMEEMKKKGYFRYYGCSNWKAERVEKAQEYAKTIGVKGFTANQMLWNVGSTHMNEPGDKTLVVMDEKLYRFHEESRMCALAYSSQAAGYFTKLINDPERAQKQIYHTQENVKRANELKNRFKDAKSPMQYVLGYLLNMSIQTIPIFTSGSKVQLKDTLYAAEHPLNPEISF